MQEAWLHQGDVEHKRPRRPPYLTLRYERAPIQAQDCGQKMEQTLVQTLDKRTGG